MRKEIHISDDFSVLSDFLDCYVDKKFFLVCDASYDFLKAKNIFDSRSSIVKFSDFSPNPDYESVKKAVNVFKSEHCDIVFALGGGSAIDLAKCVKAYVSMDDDKEFLSQPINENETLLFAYPTTAGTGSEATRYAVIYYNGVKQSITHNSLIPSVVIFDPSVLITLPSYQKRATVMDALCHGIESFWSVNSTDESASYSFDAIRLILSNIEPYLNNDETRNADMLKAANIAGKAINITQTTAGHAMCYKLTSLYHIAHGHAAALCLDKLLPYMIEHFDDCIDPRGKEFLEKVFYNIADAMGCDDISEIPEKFSGVLKVTGLTAPKAEEQDYEILKNSVNPERLSNHPVKLDTDTIDMLYHSILN